MLIKDINDVILERIIKDCLEFTFCKVCLTISSLSLKTDYQSSYNTLTTIVSDHQSWEDFKREYLSKYDTSNFDIYLSLMDCKDDACFMDYIEAYVKNHKATCSKLEACLEVQS